jgi:hypothetical protein
MKLALCIALGVAALGVAYSVGPDLTRYFKIRAM